MADDPTPDETAPPADAPRPALRAGQPLDLSTGKAPTKPPPEPVRLVPMPAPEGAPEVRVGRTVDFSTGKAPAAPRRKSAASTLGPGPVVRQTLDLSSPAPPPDAAPPAPGGQAAEPEIKRRKRSGSRPGRGGQPVSPSTQGAQSGPPSSESDSRRGGGPPDPRGGRGGPPPSRNDKRGGRPSDNAGGGRGGAASSATSLADLLDPETLARLRGGG